MPERDIPFNLARALPGWVFERTTDGTYWEVLSEHGHYILAVERFPDEGVYDDVVVAQVLAFKQPFRGEFYKVREWR